MGASSKIKGSDLIVKALENMGVDYVIGIPGEEILEIIESLHNSKIRFIPVRHEQAAVMMAATHGRLTGRPGVCLATCGPGALNLVTGVAYAQLGAMPVLIITGQKPISAPPQSRFQLIDTVSVMRPLTKMTRQIVSAASIPTLVREAFRVATDERRGAVHLEVPKDVATEDVATEMAEVALAPSHPIDRPVAAEAAIEHAAAMILSAQSPLIMIGAAGNRPGLGEPLSEFVRRTQIPFCDTQMGKGAVTGASSLYLGTAALSERDYVHAAIDRADLIISIGHDAVEKPPFLYEKIAGGLKVIHIGYTPASVEQVFHPDAEVVGDISSTVTALADRLGGRLEPDPGMLELRQSLLERINGINDGTEEATSSMTVRRIVHAVRTVMPEDGFVCLDNGEYKIEFARYYLTYAPNTLLLDNALATMGAGLPSAMMAAELYPERRVLAVCGDGGFMMNSQEMETAVRLRLNLVALILDNSAYGMIRRKQREGGFAEYGTTFTNPDFVAYANSYGATGHCVTAVRDLAPTLEAAFKAGGVHLVAVPIDDSENKRVLIQEHHHKASNIEPEE
ncbi:hypothetical protein M446_7024 (plasmid) [Methylobacterium sp. 4-46]|nr:hypothetical protein M446_7024 [Methylobacterium sp. 4-46]